MGVKAGSLESKVLYGLRPRRKGVTVLSIRLPNFTFFKIALHNKVLITYFLGGELQKLIGSQRQHSEHQMRHDLARAPHADLPSSKLILQATIHSLDQSAFPIAIGFRPAQFLLWRLRQNLALGSAQTFRRSEEHTSELQSRQYLVCRLLLE